MTSHWKEWDESDWNEALFLHFFSIEKGGARPVSRIVITAAELAGITADPGASEEAARDAFLNVLSVSPRVLRRKLSRDSLDGRRDWPDRTAPPFFLYLAFTCFVVSSMDRQIKDVGDFRKRMAGLMGHDPSTSYALPDLEALWRALEAWIRERRASGAPYRELILPDPGWMKRIGYSVNLSFPPRRDLLKLIRLLAKEGFDEEPTIPAALRVVGSKIHLFGERFRGAYESFREAFSLGRPNPRSLPFWKAVREAMAAEWDEPERRDEKVDFKLVMEVDENGEGEVALLSTAPAPSMDGGFAFIKTEAPYKEYKYVLCSPGEKAGVVKQTANRMLNGEWREGPPGAAWPKTATAIKRGVLLFRLNEEGVRELAPFRRDDGDYWALVRSELATPFREAFPVGEGPTVLPSQYDGWEETERFDGKLLSRLEPTEGSPLDDAGLRLEAPPATRMFFIGGCPVDGGFLGLPDCLPALRVIGAKFVSAYPVHDAVGSYADGRRPLRLEQVDEAGGEFRFGSNVKEPLKGRFRILARSGDRILAQRSLVFRSDIVWNDYARPTDPSAWLMEWGGPDMLPYGRRVAGRGLRKRMHRSQKKHATRGQGGVGRRPRPIHRKIVDEDDSKEFARAPDDGGEKPVRGVHRDAERFMEWCGGLAIRRKGIRETELLDRIRDGLGVRDYSRIWDVARAWVEAGYFNRLQRARWRGAVYFARQPRFVMYSHGGWTRGVLTGLATGAIRKRVGMLAERFGAKIVQRMSLGKWTPAPLSWRAESGKIFHRITAEAGLASPERLRRIEDDLWSLDRIASEPREIPMNYDHRGVWDWTEGSFGRSEGLVGSGVEIQWLRRPGRPDCFVVFMDGAAHWWSHSRNWALLIAFSLREEPCFGVVDRTRLFRTAGAQVHLPITVGRRLAVTADLLSGPCMGGRGKWTYVYEFPNRKELLETVRLLEGAGEAGEEKIARGLRWVLSLSERLSAVPPGNRAPLPSDLRKKLGRVKPIAAAMEPDAARIHPSLIPRVRKILDCTRD